MHLHNCPEFQIFLEHAPTAVAMFDHQMCYIAASHRWLTDFGFQEESVIGRYHYDVFPETPRKWETAHQSCCLGSGDRSSTDTFVRSDGSIEWVKWEIRPWYNQDGKIGGTIFSSEVITERKLAEEETQKWISLVENSSDFIGMAMLSGEGLFVNKAGQKLVGLESSQVKQVKISDYHTPEDWAYLQEHIFPIVMEKGSWRGEFRFRHFQTGAAIPIEYSIFVINNQTTGQPVALATITRDITQCKQAEDALRKSEERFRELANREQLLNRLGSQIRHSLDLDTVIETAIQEIQKLLQIDRCTFCWYRQEANPPTWEAIKEAIRPDLESLLGYYPVTVVGPVTQQLIQQEVISIDNVADFTEPTFRHLFQSIGYKSAIILPMVTLCGDIGVIVCGHCSYPRPWTQSEVELLQAVVSQVSIAINQAELYTRTHQAALTAQKQAQQLEQIIEELTSTQTQLVQSEKMSSLGQLVAGVAHEINNPVNFIFGNLAHASGYIEDLLGLLKLYQQTYPQPTPEILEEIDAIDLDFLTIDLPKLLCSMKVGADRIREIVRSLRNFSRHDEAQMKMVDIHEGIDSTLMILQYRLKDRSDRPGIEVIKDYAPLPPVSCYPGQLNQVFMNLLANAIDALEEQWMKENSAIATSNLALSASVCSKSTSLLKSTIPNPQIHIRTQVRDKDHIAIYIADNGSGMSEEVQKRLFDPFFTTKPVGIGTGLGLSISYQIVVEKHGGQLYCNSKLGQGTEFVIEIPISHPNIA
ncbi:MAG: PAS domain S-box protein [Scytonema sp. PMC 1069.18]|nr:PAS domain S-box protein [Scytonema sp. PMC 1069.18]MEC4884451.1 PAS domain S-box protein [Scytonema sp. PMC 1070.18]